MDAEPTTTKRCPDCKIEKSTTEFQQNAARHDGLSFWCKACTKVRRRAYDDAVREKVRERDRARKRDPQKMREAQARWRANHGDLANARSKVSRAKKLAEYQARARKHKKDMPELVRAHDARRRARKAGAGGNGFTAADVAAIKQAQRGRCALCREKLKMRFHRDHIVPLKRGGAHDRRNLQLLCEPCNLSKGARDPLAHAQTLGLLL